MNKYHVLEFTSGIRITYHGEIRTSRTSPKTIRTIKSHEGNQMEKDNRDVRPYSKKIRTNRLSLTLTVCVIRLSCSLEREWLFNSLLTPSPPFPFLQLFLYISLWTFLFTLSQPLSGFLSCNTLSFTLSPSPSSSYFSLSLTLPLLETVIYGTCRLKKFWFHEDLELITVPLNYVINGVIPVLSSFLTRQETTNLNSMIHE